MSQTLPLTIRMHESDNVVIANVDVLADFEIVAEGLTTRDNVNAGHKIATTTITAGQPVRRYGQVIGFASQNLEPGDHVHSHNLEFGDFDRDYAFGAETREVEMVADGERATFEGYARADGRVGTRNYLGVISTSNCSATASRYIAEAFRGEALAAWPNVDGVVVLNHSTGGCGLVPVGEAKAMFYRTFSGYARQPNFAGVLLVGLGCEGLQIEYLVEGESLEVGPQLQTMTIQDTGGTRKTVEEGIARVRDMLPEANKAERSPQPASKLVLGLECGGSDAYSGITANPALGAASDLLVRHGGTACLAETPEIYGAEHLLTRRAVSREVGEKLVERVRWWEQYTSLNGASLDNNPSPGNKEGGLTTILEKSLGAATKGGTTNLVDVYKYAEAITAQGFVFMDTPGYDPASVTGMVAGGANMVCFTTGRGSVYGCKPVPSLKLATNSRMYNHMSEDMDVNCGTVADGDATVPELGEQIFRLVLETASGKPSKSEELGMGDDEFAPWTVGATL